tara:strand:- start:1182 stop:1856 length:675 start_codon:yes stop_codon:yes gene_type:complete
MIINLFGDSFIYGVCADHHENGRRMDIDYWLSEEGWSVSNYGYVGSNNTEVLSCIKENPFSEECFCVVGVTSFLRENLPWLDFASSWGRNILQVDKYDHPNLIKPQNNKLWEDYLIYCYDDEYFNTLYKMWVLKVKHILDNTPNVKGYVFVNTVESYKKPDFVKKENYLYTDSSITDMLLNKKDSELFERGLDKTNPFVKGRAHPSTKGYKIVSEDIHDIFHTQ